MSLVGLAFVASLSAEEPGLRDTLLQRVAVDPATGSAAAVKVGPTGLMHTAQLFPIDADGKSISPGNSDEQLRSLFTHLEQILGPSEDRWNDVVKLNVCAASDEVAEMVRGVLAKKFSGPAKPATSFVVGRLARPDALVAVDAVIIDRGSTNDAVKRTKTKPPVPGTLRCSDRATLPAGRRVYISGQAEPSKEPAEATRLTLESLKRTLTHLELSLDHVVQIKSFLGPIAAVDEAEREIVRFFGDAPTPPLVFVEWTSTLPIEIELVAWGGPLPKGGTADVEYITPPGMTESPVFCRVTRVNAPETIYISGLYGIAERDGAAETREIFGNLHDILHKTGSDFRHLAKATIYVSTDEASAKLNELRPSYYDPKRPPAASKAVVAGTGRTGKTLTIDMIAVPRPPKN